MAKQEEKVEKFEKREPRPVRLRIENGAPHIFVPGWGTVTQAQLNGPDGLAFVLAVEARTGRQLLGSGIERH